MLFPHILLMKAGPYCGYSLEEIIRIKQQEEKDCGYFFWGYGGVFCRPEIVQAFVKHSESKISGLFSETKSSFEAKEFGKFKEYSQDGVNWQRLPPKVLLVGNVNKPHFAIVGKNLIPSNSKINLKDYQVFLKDSLFEKLNKRLDQYFNFRVDKACGIYCPNQSSNDKIINISYSFKLIKPFCVYIR